MWDDFVGDTYDYLQSAEDPEPMTKQLFARFVLCLDAKLREMAPDVDLEK